MAVKLYGYSIATSTQTVATILLEKKVDFVFVTVDLDDDGFIVYESRAIARYVAEKWADQGTQDLVPLGNDLKKKALFEQAVSIETTNFHAHAGPATGAKVFLPFWGLPPDEATFNAEVKKLEGRLDVYDKILAKQKYLGLVHLQDLTLADLFHLPTGALLATAGSTALTDRPNVARWWKDISSRESWQTILKDGVKSTHQ